MAVWRKRGWRSAAKSFTVDAATSNKIKLATKLATEYKDVQTLPPVLQAQQTGPAGPKRPGPSEALGGAGLGVKLIGGLDGASV